MWLSLCIIFFILRVLKCTQTAELPAASVNAVGSDTTIQQTGCGCSGDTRCPNILNSTVCDNRGECEWTCGPPPPPGPPGPPDCCVGEVGNLNCNVYNDEEDCRTRAVCDWICDGPLPPSTPEPPQECSCSGSDDRCYNIVNRDVCSNKKDCNWGCVILFPTEAEFRDVCLDPMDDGSTPTEGCTPDDYAEKIWQYNIQTGKCKSVDFYGCTESENIWPSEAECITRCLTASLTFECSFLLFFGFFQSLGEDNPFQGDLQLCRNAFFQGALEVFDCYDIERYSTDCPGTVCTLEFTAHELGLSWLEPFCLPPECVNDLDFMYLSNVVRETCVKEVGGCDVLIDCNTSPVLLSEKKGTSSRHNSNRRRPPQNATRARKMSEYRLFSHKNEEECALLHDDCSSIDCCSGHNIGCTSNGKCVTKCFASTSTVITRSGIVKLEDVGIGEFVLAWDLETNSLMFDEVYYIAHHGSTDLVPIIRISYGGGAGTLELSSSHLLYLHPQDDRVGDRSCVFIKEQKACTYMAKDVHVGSVLYALKGGTLTAFSVDALTEITSTVRGILTISGNVVIDGVLSSCYIQDHNYKHATLIIPRWFYENLWFLPAVFRQSLRNLFILVDDIKDFTKSPSEYVQLGTTIVIITAIYGSLSFIKRSLSGIV